MPVNRLTPEIFDRLPEDVKSEVLNKVGNGLNFEDIQVISITEEMDEDTYVKTATALLLSLEREEALSLIMLMLEKFISEKPLPPVPDKNVMFGARMITLHSLLDMTRKELENG